MTADTYRHVPSQTRNVG